MRSFGWSWSLVAVVAVAGFCVYRLHGLFARRDNLWSAVGFSMISSR